MRHTPHERKLEHSSYRRIYWSSPYSSKSSVTTKMVVEQLPRRKQQAFRLPEIPLRGPFQIDADTFYLDALLRTAFTTAVRDTLRERSTLPEKHEHTHMLVQSSARIPPVAPRAVAAGFANAAGFAIETIAFFTAITRLLFYFTTFPHLTKTFLKHFACHRIMLLSY